MSWWMLGLVGCVTQDPWPAVCDDERTELSLSEVSSYGFSADDLIAEHDRSATLWTIEWDTPSGPTDTLTVSATARAATEVQAVTTDGSAENQIGCEALVGLVVEADLSLTTDDGAWTASGTGALRAQEVPAPGEHFEWSFRLPLVAAPDRLADLEAELGPDETIEELFLSMGDVEVGIEARTATPDGQHRTRMLTRAPLDGVEMASP